MTGRAAPALAELLLGLAVVMIVWISWDRRPPECDHAIHLERALHCHWSLAEPARGSLSLRADAVRYGRLRLPRLLVDWIVRNFDPTPRLRRLPMAVSLAPIALGRERLEIGDPKETGMLCPEETR